MKIKKFFLLLILIFLLRFIFQQASTPSLENFFYKKNDQQFFSSHLDFLQNQNFKFKIYSQINGNLNSEKIDFILIQTGLKIDNQIISTGKFNFFYHNPNTFLKLSSNINFYQNNTTGNLFIKLQNSEIETNIQNKLPTNLLKNLQNTRINLDLYKNNFNFSQINNSKNFLLLKKTGETLIIKQLSGHNYLTFSREKNINNDGRAIYGKIFPHKNSQINFEGKIIFFSTKFSQIHNFPLQIKSKIRFQKISDNQNISQIKYFVNLSDLLLNFIFTNF